jgi:hypothetical protein
VYDEPAPEARAPLDDALAGEDRLDRV